MEDINSALRYVSQLFMDLTGFIELGWEFDGDDAVVIFNKSDEGSPMDDNWEAATLISKLTGWEPYEITRPEEWKMWRNKPFRIGLKRK